MSDVAIRYRVHIRHTQSGQVDVLAGEFSQSASAQLRRFVREVRILERAKFVAGGMRTEWRIQRLGDDGFVPPTLPSDAELAEFLYRLRPIVLEEEPTSFVNASSLLARQLDHLYVRQRLKRLGRHFRALDVQRSFRIYSNDLLVNCEETLRLWLNGFEYHRDGDKARLIEASSTGLPFDIQKAIYIDMLSAKTKAAVSLANWIEQIGRTAAEIPPAGDAQVT